MDRDSSEPSYAGRRQFLNIVYFVESAKTHTLRINLRHARWAVCVACLVCLWALGSIAWIVALESQIRGTRIHLASSLAAIFDYQIKTDKIFEAAYPSDTTTNYYSESAQLPSNNPVIDSKSTIEKVSGAEKVATLAQSGTPTPASVPTTALTHAATLPPAIAQATSPSVERPTTAVDNKSAVKSITPVKVETAGKSPTQASESTGNGTTKPLLKLSDTKLSILTDKISLAFNLTNPNTTKAEGYIWAVAKITRDGLPPSFLPAPAYVHINSKNGEITDSSSAYRFSIKSFKSKSFDFVVPPGGRWTVSEVNIHISDLAGTFDRKTSLPFDAIATAEKGGRDEGRTDKANAD
jgi:hypothetical protein